MTARGIVAGTSLGGANDRELGFLRKSLLLLGVRIPG
jgi:hypothetical protein